MLLNANKFSAPDGVIHWAWLHSRETFCGILKTHWPYPPYGSTPITCEACRNAYVVTAIDEAHSDCGFVIKTESA